MDDKLGSRKRRTAKGLATAAIGGLGLSLLGVVGAAPPWRTRSTRR
ncbi:hypothetical protein ACFQY7_43195 [Actinomadura luteofluorescens]